MTRARQALWAIAIIAVFAIILADADEAKSIAVVIAAVAAALASARMSLGFLLRLAVISLCALVASPATNMELQMVFGVILALGLGIYLIIAFIAFAVGR